MAKFLVSLDGSHFSEAVLPTAVRLATLANADLVLVRSVNPPETEVRAHGRLVATDEQASPTLREESEGYLAGIANRLVQDGMARHRISCEVTWGDPAKSIVESATGNQVDLILMATHGRTGVARMMVGSVAEAVLHRSPVPITLVRPNSLRP